MAYKNAAIILPPELLKRVREYHVGMLYVPPAEGNERDKEIMKLSRQGLKSSQIAEIFYISARRVRQILQEIRQAEVIVKNTSLSKNQRACLM